MQRIDYLDTDHGMGPKQYVCVGVNQNIYWIDDKNRSVLAASGNQVINLSERTNVQSILNEQFNNTNITIHHDTQNDELLCKCLNDGKQIVFNTKLNVASSIYTRNYEDMVRLYNTLYGITKSFNKLYKYNNVSDSDNADYKPSQLSFVVNNNTSTTKVFDNQEIVFSNVDDLLLLFDDHTQFEFNTNIDESYTQCSIQSTSKEGNIEYAVPRINNAEYGSRMRGKWMKTTIKSDGSINNAISHIITKFRQSF